MKNLKEPDKFMINGGAEKGVMSTTRDVKVAADYARASAAKPLFFRIKVSTPMDMGAPAAVRGTFELIGATMHEIFSFTNACSIRLLFSSCGRLKRFLRRLLHSGSEKAL